MLGYRSLPKGMLSTPPMIDRSQYTNAPMGTIDETVTLGGALVESFKTKKKKKENVVEALAYIEDRIVAVQALQVAQAKQLNTPTTTGIDPVLTDLTTDRYWRGLKLRLEAASMLPATNPDAGHAAFALQRIFGDDGLEFLGLPHAAQYNQMKIHLVPLFGDDEGKGKEPGLLETVKRIAGEEYVDAVVGQMEPYGKMVMAKATSTATVTVAVAPVHRELQDAIVDLAMAIIGNVKRGDADALAEAKQLLLPIDNARAKSREAAAAKRSKTKVIEGPVAKLPGVPAGTGDVDVGASVAKTPEREERKPN